MTATRNAVLFSLFFITITTAQLLSQNARNQINYHRFNFFDTELFQKVAEQAGPINFVISPASTKALLSMVLEGAGGKSAEEIKYALRIDNEKALNRMQLKLFLETLTINQPGIYVTFGNRVYVAKGTSPRREYEEILNESYYAGIEELDFHDVHNAATTINDWVSRTTQGQIRTLVRAQTLSPQTTALLLNTVYFKGKWQIPFDNQATKVRCFFPPKSDCRKAYFMESHGLYPYAYIKELNAEALEVPYQGSQFSMVFIYPHGEMDQLLRDLPLVSIDRIIQKLETTTVIVSIPRFSMEYETNLVGALNKLHINEIFGAKANFSGMLEYSDTVYINSILQKAIIEVNEEGTVGAAATGAAAVPLMGSPLPKFYANKPFLFFLRDKEYGNYLFQGQVVLPEIAYETPDPPPNRNQPSGNTPIETQYNNQQSGNRPIQTQNNNQPSGNGPTQAQNNNQPRVPNAAEYQPSGNGPTQAQNNNQPRVPNAAEYIGNRPQGGSSTTRLQKLNTTVTVIESKYEPNYPYV